MGFVQPFLRGFFCLFAGLFAHVIWRSARPQELRHMQDILGQPLQIVDDVL
jgi:hypothetical protein